MRKVFVFIMLAIVITSAGAALFSSATAGGPEIAPITDLEDTTFKVDSPQAMRFYNYADTYVRLLMYLDSPDGIEPVEVYGYYYQNREKTQVVYSIWIPEWILTGRYDLHVEVQRRAWVYVEYIQEDGSVNCVEGYYGPWETIFRENYNIVVVDSDQYRLGSIDSESLFGNDALDIEGGVVGDVMDHLNSGQMKTLKQTLQDEVEQRGC